jgi:hypothetical protein
MPDFDTRTRQDPNEPNSRPHGPSMAGRVGKLLITILRWFPIASYALAHIIVVGFWAYIVSEVGVAAFDLGLLRAFLATAKMILITAILMVPVGAFLGAFDAAARLSSHPLRQMLLLLLDALLIVLFALAWIAFVGIWLSYEYCDEYTCVTITPDWPMYIGLLIGAELGLVMLMVTSVTERLSGKR